MDKYVAFIPVRGGSKSIPLKNIKEIAGQPLVYWVIDATVNTPQIDKVYISTDSEDIKRVVEEYDKDNKEKIKIIDRSPETATDTASTESAMLEFANNYDFENIILIQATSPLLTTKDLREGIERYEKEGFDSLLSVVPQKRFIWKYNNDGSVSPQNYDYKNRPRRQDFGGFLVENGAFYIISKENFLKTECRLTGRIGCQEMNEKAYYEIDEPSDWEVIEKLLRNTNNEHKRN
jgi:N-acylneuraminate cytidylyltransferase